MTLHEEALKEFVSQLPDPENDRETDGLGYDQQGYIDGVRDAYRVLIGEQPQHQGSIIEHAKKIRSHAPIWDKRAFRPGRYCKVCGTGEQEGNVSWHSSTA